MSSSTTPGAAASCGCANTTGNPVKPSAHDWKDIFTAYKNGETLYAGIEGGFVRVGASTRKMTTKELTELIELMYWFGAEKGVNWSDPEERSLMETYGAV